MTGLITMTNMTSPIAVTVDNQLISPLSSDVTLKDSILENQTLFYQTNYQQTLSKALCESQEEEFESPIYYISNRSQEITFDSNNNLLNVHERVNEEDYEYNITSTSNIPVGSLFDYPYDNGWQHNYPKEASEIILNPQEITNITLDNEISLVLSYKFEETKDLNYGDINISTHVFTNSSNFAITLGSG
jgi:hypothetical protein